MNPQTMNPDATPPRGGTHFRLGDIARARSRLVKTETTLSNSIKENETPGTIAGCKRSVNGTHREMSHLEAAVCAVIVNDPAHARRVRFPRTIRGIGAVV